MTSYESVYKVVNEYFACLKAEGVLQRTEFNEADCKYLVDKIMQAVDEADYENLYIARLEAIQDSQASY